MENKDLNVLWRPSSKIKEESNLNQFIKNFVDEFKNQSDVKYEELWKWSIEKPEKFWDSIWDYSNVQGEKGDILIKDKLGIIKVKELLNIKNLLSHCPKNLI